MSLPIVATAVDIEDIVSYLKTKAMGATQSEAKGAVRSELLDTRKMSAYKAWGFVSKEGDKLKLTPRGRDFSRSSIDKKQSIFRDVIRDIKPYYLAMEWAFYQRFEQITAEDLGAHWDEHCKDEVGTTVEKSVREMVSCFFSVAEAAALGTYIKGRSGRPSRLEINRDALDQFIGETGLIEGTNEQEESKPVSVEEVPANGNGRHEIVDETLEEVGIPAELLQPITNGTKHATEPAPDRARVFISHSKNMAMVERIKDLLEYAEIEFEVAVEEETTALPVTDKVLGAMRRCNGAVICVTADEQSLIEGSKYSINENVLIEIGAAFVLYDKRVVLLWDKRLPIPSNLQGLYRCEFQGEELTADSILKLLKAFKLFRGKQVA